MADQVKKEEVKKEAEVKTEAKKEAPVQAPQAEPKAKVEVKDAPALKPVDPLASYSETQIVTVRTAGTYCRTIGKRTPYTGSLTKLQIKTALLEGATIQTKEGNFILISKDKELWEKDMTAKLKAEK